MLERVQKIIANAGITSRRKAEILIDQGMVQVNGKTIKLGDKADPDNDEVTVADNIIKKGERKYYAFHKPIDCLTTLKDPQGRKTIFDVYKTKERLIPVGRLDYKTEGLLILTNDGDFANRVMHPRYEVTKTYVVYIDRSMKKEDVTKLTKGVELEGVGKAHPAKVNFVTDDKKVVQIKIHEGKNRIVRRMMRTLGYKIRRLIRTGIGTVHLDNLRRGKVRPLSPMEVKSFLE